jgi:hypothetical protein
MTSAAALGCGALGCGAEPSSTLIVSQQTAERIAGHFAAEGHEVEFAAESSGLRAGSVQLRMGALTYDLRYDFEGNDFEGNDFEGNDFEGNDFEGTVGEGRQVSVDGYGAAIDRAAPPLLGSAIQDLTRYLGPARPESPMQEQMLVAAFQLVRDSGGMPLLQQRFPLGPKQVSGEPVASHPELDLEKSLDDDGIRCIRSGTSYFVSFDYGDSTVIDEVVQAGIFECNGQCGPTCTQLQPWRMWTLDCLEHDSCCNATSDDTCWTPVGECGDEYDAAMGDFLRGFDPFGKHCGG